MAKKKRKIFTHGGKRDGAGRKPMFDEYAKISVSMDASLVEKLDAYCRRHDLNRSQAVRKILEKTTN